MDLKKLCYLLAAILCSIAGAAPISVFGQGPSPAQPGQAVDLDLTAGYRLGVEGIAESRFVTVSLLYENALDISVSIGNALFIAEDVVTTKLCAACSPVVFIPAPDDSSTYGASTGIVAWSDGGHWQLSILPLQSPFLTGPDAAGVSTLKDRRRDDENAPIERSYTFYRGSVYPASDWHSSDTP